MKSKREPQPILPAAGRTSVTVVHDSTKSYGLRLTRCSNGEDTSDDILIDMIANHHSNGMLKDSPMNEGDILKTINNKRASDFLGCRNSIRSGTFQDGQSVTFVIERPSENETQKESDNDNNERESDSPVVRAFCRRSITTTNDRRQMAVGVEFHRVILGEEVDVDGRKSDEDSGCDDDKSSKSSFLQIDRIDPNGLFAHSVLNQGDVVLAINGYSICADENTTVEEANELMGVHHAAEPAPSSGVSVYETVDILALNPRKLLELKRKNTNSSRWHQMKRQAKRVGVALGGGAMVGVGTVLHAVPPVGTILTCSGVSVLATEFDTPNRIVRSARNSLEKWTMDEEHMLEFSKEDMDMLEDSETEGSSVWSSVWFGEESTPISKGISNDCGDIISNNPGHESAKSTPPSPPLPPLPTMTNRMKGLGRRYVLPFLDKMAGDRRMPSGIEPSSSFDIGENYHNAISSTMLQQSREREQLQQRRHQFQGRDDQSSESSFPSEEDLQPPSVSQRVT